MSPYRVKARKLRATGMKYTEIALDLDISPSWAYHLCNYPNSDKTPLYEKTTYEVPADINNRIRRLRYSKREYGKNPY